jgi:hypothetical protein
MFSWHHMRLQQSKFLIWITALCNTNCADHVYENSHTAKAKDDFVSATYNHFEGGLIVSDIDEGIDLLWRASFKNGRPYKENLGFLIPEGLLITPNASNSPNNARLSVYRKVIEDEKLWVNYNGHFYQVLAILHTHPHPADLQTPSPRHDFQYGFMGIHNFIISRNHIYDAYKDKKGNEVFRTIGNRHAGSIILAIAKNENIATRQTYYSD